MFRLKHSYRVISFLIALSLLVLGLPSSASAGGGLKYAAPTAVGAGDCSSWANACTLHTALLNASNGNEIWVKAGVHYPGTDRSDTFFLTPIISVLGGFAGTESDRDQRNWLVNRTILSGDIDKNDVNTDGNFIAETTEDIIGSNSYHVVTGLEGTEPEPNTSTLDGFIITAGHASGDSPLQKKGGGMYNNPYTDLRLTNLVFSGNWASGGGGMYNDKDASSILNNVTFTGNEADVLGGAGMYNNKDSCATLTGVHFINNKSAGFGGGMYNYNIDNNPTTLTNVTFIGNQASTGGGIANSLEASPTLINVIFIGNTATNNGGGINNYVDSSPMLINVTFHNNSAPNGGGIRNNIRSQPTLANVIMWGDHATNGPEIYNGDTASKANIAFSDIQGSFISSVWNTELGDNNGHNIDADPHFIAPTHGNLRLHWTSPAIDAGNKSAVPAGILTDLDGNPRFVDLPFITDTGVGTTPIVDMGAYEAQAFLLTLNILGNGEVNKNPDQPTYNFSEKVTLTAIADPGWAFSGWSGDASGTSNPLTVIIQGNTTVTAIFIEDRVKIYLPMVLK